MLSDAWYRLRAILRRQSVERELDDELRFHVERQTQKYLRAGRSAAEAARLARLEFGGIDQTKEQCRDARGLSVWEAAGRNLRLACRTLGKRPGFAVVVVLTLALGIGANSAVFTAIRTILLQSLAFPDAQDLMRLEQYEPRTANPPSFVAPPRLEDWQRLSQSFQAITGYYPGDISETSGDVPERLASVWVAPRFLQVWGVVPALGRGFAPEEERFGGPRVVIVSDRLWKRRFGPDATLAGQRLRVGQQSLPIVGVMPESFRFPLRDVDVWAPSPVDAPFAQSRQSTWFTVIGRVRHGVTAAEAQADLDRVQAQLARAFPATDAAIAVRVQPLKDVIVGDVGRSLWLLFAAVSVLLLIACTNIAALLLARTADRQQESRCATRWAPRAARSSPSCSPNRSSWQSPDRLPASSWQSERFAPLTCWDRGCRVSRSCASTGRWWPTRSAARPGRRCCSDCCRRCARRSIRPAIRWRPEAAASRRRHNACSGCSSACRSPSRCPCCSAPGCCSGASMHSDGSLPASSPHASSRSASRPIGARQPTSRRCSDACTRPSPHCGPFRVWTRPRRRWRRRAFPSSIRPRSASSKARRLPTSGAWPACAPSRPTTSRRCGSRCWRERRARRRARRRRRS